MEDTLGAIKTVMQGTFAAVLILVLMADTLGETSTLLQATTSWGLNPCSNGRYSRSSLALIKSKYHFVLILVLMEDTLGDLGTCRCVMIISS